MNKLMVILASVMAVTLGVRAERSVTVFVTLAGKPTEAEIEQKLDALQSGGVDSFMLYPKYGLQMEYLGNEFWKRAEAFARGAEKRHMKMWLYDEFGWPSGSCRGKVPAESDRFRLSEISLHRDASGNFTWAKTLAPRGWVNLLEPDAVKRFIELTHLEYARHLKPWIQSGTIRGIFTDEPGHPVKMNLPPNALAHFRWYEGLEAEYAVETGRDFRQDVERWAVDKSTDEVWAVYARLYGRRFRASYYD